MTKLDTAISRNKLVSVKDLKIGDKVQTLDVFNNPSMCTVIGITSEDKEVFYIKTKNTFIEASWDTRLSTIRGDSYPDRLRPGDLLFGYKGLDEIKAIAQKGIETCYTIETDSGSFLVNGILVKN